MEKWETSLASLRAMVKFFKVCGTPSRGLNSFLAWNPHQAPVPPFHTLYVLMVRAPFFSPKPLQRLGVGGGVPLPGSMAACVHMLGVGSPGLEMLSCQTR